jgi:hypothetical protein
MNNQNNHTLDINPFYKSLATLVLMFVGTIGLSQPRVIKRTVYSNEGNKVGGVIVNAHKSKGKYYRSFDGYYEINANNKSK